MDKKAIRHTVLQSLRAISPSREALFYAKLFQSQDPAQFALVVIDGRCLSNPLLDVLVSDLKILSDLALTPVLLIGAMCENLSNVPFQSARLCKALESHGIKNTKLNCASYQLISQVKQFAGKSHIPVLEITDLSRGESLQSLSSALSPQKIIFLQPSGGITENGRRRAVINIDHLDTVPDRQSLSDEQTEIISCVRSLAKTSGGGRTYVIVSPLNLLSELFTIKGSGTMLRQGADILTSHNYDGLKINKLRPSIEAAFDRTLVPGYFDRPVYRVFTEKNYRGGAILTQLAGLPYLNKFWVSKEAQGEGIARDIWHVLCASEAAFFWRTQKTNPFNDWYMKMCDGMQVSGGWRIFWMGLQAPEIPSAISAAANAPIDFENNNNNDKSREQL